MLATTLGDWERAEDHFERAIALNRQMEAMTWLAHTEYEYARLMVARGKPQRAAALLEEADRHASSIGMTALRNRIRGLRAPNATMGAAPAGLPDGLSAR